MSSKMKKYPHFSTEQILLFASIVAAFPLIFRNALVYQFPMGYAGLFTQMAQQIADANFLLPVESPYYGPGGIPFAYPPFGLYLLAFFIKLTGKYYFFLRWLPPLFSLVSVVLTFLLSLKLFKSPFIATFTAIIAATSSELYVAHAWSAGIVRAPAFIFTILTIYFYSRNLEDRSMKNIALTGLFLGLSFLSHLAYALFCLAWITFYSLVSHNWLKRIGDSVLSSLAGSLVASIWIIPVISRHGWGVFLGAFNSHGGENISSVLVNIKEFLRLLQINFSPISTNPMLVVLFLFGVYFLLKQKTYNFILFFLLITLAFPENARFVFWLGCFFTGCGLLIISNWLYRFIIRINITYSDFGILFFSVPILAFIWWGGINAISRRTPLLNEFALELGNRAQEIFPVNTKYLALLAQDEAEWLPFLLEREPLVAQWGSEWLGEYSRQTSLMLLFQGCRKEKDWLCVQTTMDHVEKPPQFVITYRIEKKMNDQIFATGQWVDVFSNNRYIVWRAAQPP
jgi:hypothetical protein